jgi:ribokinase
MTATVTVVGSLHMDFIAVAERLPAAGESLMGISFSMHPGGKAGNQATQLALHGLRTYLISRVGRDVLGDELRNRLGARGVCLHFTTVDPERPTGASPVFVGRDGEYASIIVPGAASALNADDIERARSAIEASAAIVMQLEVPLETSRLAAAFAKRAGARVVLNASPLPPGPLPDLLAPVRGLVDLLIVNKHEAERLSGSSITGPADALVAARALRAQAECDEVVVTLGPAGALAVTASAELYHPAFSVPVVDSVGAGDAFAGTLVARLLKGDVLQAALRSAVAAGAIAVSRPGAFDALPAPADIQALLER